MQERIIIHLDMDYFFAQVEERESPQFRGKPVVVGADPKGGKGRGVVSTCNYEARKYGLHSAMPISRAYQLCPEAVFLPPNFALYSESSQNIMEIIRSFSAQLEQISLDEAYIDVTYITTIVEEGVTVDSWIKAKKMAEDMRMEILKKERLTCSCGVGPNKMIAKIACEEAKSRLAGGQAPGVKVVQAKDAEKFIEHMDIQKIPGIGVKTAQILHGSGMNTITDLKRLSDHNMENVFGSRGKSMYSRVRGVDEDPVVAERQPKSIGKEHTFEQDTRDPELLIRTFEQLSKQVAREIEEEGVVFKTITVVCRFSGFETHTKSKTLKDACFDSAVLQTESMKLLLRFIMEKQKPIRLIGIRAGIA